MLDEIRGATTMIDLGTLGGANGWGTWVNDAGAIAGSADLAAAHHHGFLRANRHMRDLFPVDNAPYSNGNVVNNRGKVVGNIADCHGMNWRRSCGAIARDTT